MAILNSKPTLNSQSYQEPQAHVFNPTLEKVRVQVNSRGFSFEPQELVEVPVSLADVVGEKVSHRGLFIVWPGQDIKEMERLLKVVSIPANPEVRVRITSGVAHTKEAKRDILMTLRAGGDVSRQTLLENLDIDPEEEQERIAEEQAPQGPQGGMEGIDPNAPLPEGMQLQI